MHKILQIIILTLIFASLGLSWDLRPLNISAFSVVHVSLYCNKAFLSIESSKSKKIPTLIEASWPENLLNIRPKVFSEDQTIRFLRPGLVCDEIIKARVTDIDRKGHLWVLDNGGQHLGRRCLPKLLIHNLILLNERLHVHEFPEFQFLKFSSMVMDPVTVDEADTRAFFMFHESEFIVLYSLREKKYVKISFESNDVFLPRKPTFTEAVIASNDVMYLLDSGRLFSIYITTLRFTPIKYMEMQRDKKYSHSSVSIRVPLQYNGQLLGRAKGLSIHPKGKIYYILPRDGAVLSWHPKFPLAAEYHDVVYMHGGNLTQVIFGWKGSVWVVSKNYLYEPGKKFNHAIRIKYP